MNVPNQRESSRLSLSASHLLRQFRSGKRLPNRMSKHSQLVDYADVPDHRGSVILMVTRGHGKLHNDQRHRADRTSSFKPLSYHINLNTFAFSQPKPIILRNPILRTGTLLTQPVLGMGMMPTHCCTEFNLNIRSLRLISGSRVVRNTLHKRFKEEGSQTSCSPGPPYALFIRIRNTR